MVWSLRWNGHSTKFLQSHLCRSLMECEKRTHSVHWIKCFTSYVIMSISSLYRKQHRKLWSQANIWGRSGEKINALVGRLLLFLYLKKFLNLNLSVLSIKVKIMCLIYLLLTFSKLYTRKHYFVILARLERTEM